MNCLVVSKVSKHPTRYLYDIAPFLRRALGLPRFGDGACETKDEDKERNEKKKKKGRRGRGDKSRFHYNISVPKENEPRKGNGA